VPPFTAPGPHFAREERWAGSLSLAIGASFELLTINCQVRLCGRAGKKSFESGPIDAKEIGLVQIVLGEGTRKNGEDFEVEGLRGRASNLIIKNGLYTVMASQAQIEANRRNALRSTGPVSPEGRCRSAQNSRKHGMRAEREELARAEGIAYESRYMRWAATYAVETDPEEFLLNANLFLASDMDRVRFAYLELTQSQIDNAENEEIKEACETGSRLFSDSHGVPLPLYGTRRVSNKKPAGPSWGSENAPALEPGKLVEKMTSSAMGCYWILNVLEELLERVRKRFWAAGDRLRMIRLLGRHPVDGIADRRVAEIFAASHALRPVRKPFDDLLSDMTEQVLEAHVKEIAAMWPDLSRRGEPEKARQSLIDLVEGEIERVRAIAAEHEENAGDDAARTRALNGFVFSPKAEAMRRWFARAKGSVERGVKVLRQETRARKANSDAQNVAPVPAKPATPNGKGRGWESVVVEESDILACGGYLPETYLGGAGENDHDSEAAPATALTDDAPNPGTASSESEEGGTSDTHLDGSGAGEITQEGLAQHADAGCDDGVGDGALGALTLDFRECQPSAAGGGDCVNAPNEANCGDDVCIAQPQEIIEVPTHSGGVSGLDGCQANPISLETKPNPAGGSEAGGAGGSTKPEARPLTERERRDAWVERRRREWIRDRAEKEARAREQRARLGAGVTDAGTTSSRSGEGGPPHDVRGP
jgi:hypothetical protein